MKIKTFLSIFVSLIITITWLSSCGKTETVSQAKDSSSKETSQAEVQTSEEIPEENFTFKSTEELLTNGMNVAMDGYVVVMDKEDIPEYMRDIMIPFNDEDKGLHAYKTLYGDVKLEPQFGINSDFLYNNIAFARPQGENSGYAAINSKGELLTKPETMSVCWVGNGIIKYHDITLDGNYETHLLDTDLNEYDISSFLADYPARDKLDITPEHVGGDYEYDGSDINGIAYGKYQNGFLPYSKKDQGCLVSGLLHENGNIAAEYDGYGHISTVAYGYYYAIFDEFGEGKIYTDKHELVAEDLVFQRGYFRLTENMIYPGGYTYVFIHNVNGIEPYVIKIDPDVNAQ